RSLLPQSSKPDRRGAMKPGQFSLSSMFWMVTLAGAIIAGSSGAVVVAVPLSCVSVFILANRYRKRVESDPSYVPPTEEQIAEKHTAQNRGCIASAVVVLVIIVAL